MTHPNDNSESLPGFKAAIVSEIDGIRLEAWRDSAALDSNFNVVVRTLAGAESETDLFGLRPADLKSLGEAFLSLHRQLAPSTPPQAG